MSTAHKPVSVDVSLSEKLEKARIGIAIAEWNIEITEAMKEGAKSFLIKSGIREENILIHRVPGSFELPLAAQFLFEIGHLDAVICIGCLVKGETDHYHYIADAVSKGILNVSLKYNKPAAFGVLTVDNIQQAKDRTGGKFGNKGEEAAEAVLKMLNLKESAKQDSKPKTGIGFSR
jgi:6,7-dimethyl-8-ribityllumazine synthase